MPRLPSICSTYVSVWRLYYTFKLLKQNIQTSKERRSFVNFIFFDEIWPTFLFDQLHLINLFFSLSSWDKILRIVQSRVLFCLIRSQHKKKHTSLGLQKILVFLKIAQAVLKAIFLVCICWSVMCREIHLQMAQLSYITFPVCTLNILHVWYC